MTDFISRNESVGHAILKALRQRPPFLFIDSLDPAPPPAAVVAYFTFPVEAPYFAGHFPGDPVVPGVLLVEAMAQAARCALHLYLGIPTPGYLVGVDGCRFQRLVRPGERLTLHATLDDAAKLSRRATTTMQTVEARCGVFKARTRVARAKVTLHVEALSMPRTELSDIVTKKGG